MRQLRSMAVVFALLAGCTDGEIDSIVPMVTIDPAIDSLTASFNQAAVRGCEIVVYDHTARSVHLYRAATRVRTFGKSGGGPGEIGHIFAIGLGPDGSIMALDWGRRRRLWWSEAGELRRDDPLLHGHNSHANVGPIIPDSNGLYFDLPLGGHVSGTAMTAAELDSLPLAYAIDSLGRVMASWGSLQRPESASALLLRSVLQVGDITATAESLYVLQGVQPRIAVFARNAPSRAPVRIVALGRWRDAGTPTERAGRVAEDGLVEGSRVELHQAATVFARDVAGRFYVVMLAPESENTRSAVLEGPWPGEQIWIFGPDGDLLQRFSHPGRNTRMLGIARDGALIALTHPGAAEDETWNLLIYPRLDAEAGAGMACRWTG